ncbi:MAG: hypothetical protein WCD18_19515 [Thermosynechococcaceae cyanobacterium]
MDRNGYLGMVAELRGQLRLVERVYDRLQDRAQVGLDTASKRDSVAYQVHNLYCAAEDLLKLVARVFENQIGTGGDWHRVILLRLSEAIEGIRPALLSEETFGVMNALRGFRHFVRHVYGAEIEVTQLKVNLELAIRLKELLLRM